MNKKNLSIIVVFIILFVILFGFIIYNSLNKSENNKISLVDNYSIFFTVDDCINKYINYINDSENSKLMNVLNKEYINLNNVDLNNVLNIIDNYNLRGKISSFKSIKMYQNKISNYVTKYYILGKIYNENSEDIEYITDTYFIVSLNKSDSTFDIEPYNGEIFRGEINE